MAITSVSPTTVAGGDPVTVVWMQGKSKSREFVGIWPAGWPGIFDIDNKKPDAYWVAGALSWSKGSGTGGTVTLTAPTTPGSYTVWSVAPEDGGSNGSYTVPLVVSTPVAQSAGSGNGGNANAAAAGGGNSSVSLSDLLSMPGPGGLPMGAIVGFGLLAAVVILRR